jgi:hypothetical protein
MLHIYVEMKLVRYLEKSPRWRSGELSRAHFVMRGVRGVTAWLLAFRHLEHSFF